MKILLDELISAIQELLFLSKTETLLIHESLHSKTLPLSECPKISCRYASERYARAEAALARARTERL